MLCRVGRPALPLGAVHFGLTEFELKKRKPWFFLPLVVVQWFPGRAVVLP